MSETELEPSGLTAREEMFVASYLRDHRSDRAAVEAGYAETRAKQTGHEILHRPAVQAEITRREALILDEIGVTAYAVARELWNLALHAEKDADKIRALALLGKWRGLWADVQVQADVTFTLDIPRPGA